MDTVLHGNRVRMVVTVYVGSTGQRKQGFSLGVYSNVFYALAIIMVF